MNDNVVSLIQSSPTQDLLTDLIRNGARDLIARAVEAELNELLAQYATEEVDGKRRVVRNGYLPARQVQTGVGAVEVKIPKVRDRACGGVKFNSSLIPPYLKRSKSIEDLLPLLYLKGISTGDFNEALEALLGKGAAGLSAGTISRLKADWEQEQEAWSKRSLSDKEYVYVWADGVYFGVRGDDDRTCILVLMGATAQGKKELIALESGYRENAQGWRELLVRLKNKGLQAPKLAIGDGALGFWKALNEVYATTRHQRCWVHKTANVLNKLPKSVQPKVKQALHEIWMAETKEAAIKAFDTCIERFNKKYPGAMACLEKSREELLTFYDFPAEHWVSIRTTNPIESTFATVRLRTDKKRNCVSTNTILAMVFKLFKSAEKSWYKLRGTPLLAEVITGVNFKDGVKVVEKLDEDAA